MLEKINALKAEIAELQAANAEAVEALRIKYLSKKGAVSQLMADFRNVAADQKKAIGMAINELKNLATESTPLKKPPSSPTTPTTISTSPARHRPCAWAHAIPFRWSGMK